MAGLGELNIVLNESRIDLREQIVLTWEIV